MITLAPRIRAALVAATATLALGCAAVPARAALPQLGGSVDLASYKPNAAADGAASSDQAGTAVAAAGDVNGDGLADVIVGAPNADANARRDSGSAFVVFGRADGASLDLGRIGSGGGFRIDGAATTDRLGAAVSPAGDVNGDGLADVIVGARFADPAGRVDAGAAYVVFGKASTGAVDLANLGTQGFRIDGGTAGDRAGTSVAGARDVSGDGRPDLLVGAPLADPSARTNAGSVYVVFGQPSPAEADTAALGGAGYAVAGAAAGDQLSTAAAVRDVTGDGRGDVFVGARFADPAGRLDAGAAYVVAGKADGATVDLSSPGTASYAANGAAAGDGAGAALAQGGDLDGDGRGELLLGAPGAGNNGRAGSGSAYVLLGVDAGGTHDLAALDATWRIDGAAAGDQAGSSLAAGSDVNSDGRVDLVVGTPFADRSRADTGGARLLYGGRFAGSVDLAGDVPGFKVLGAAGNDQAATSVAMTPDSNGDGRGELIVGSPRADRLGRGDNGSAYFLWGFGSGNLAYPSAGATTVNAPLAPLAPQQIVRTGPIAFSISPALPPGITLDPRTGVITGVPTAIQEQPTTYRLTMTDLAGSISVPVTLRVAPAPGRCANPHDGTPKPDTIVGTGGGDRIATADGGDEVQGLAGDDCISGEGGLDTLSGGDGDDELRGGKDNDTIDAGTGADRAFGDSGQDTITGGGDRDVVYGGSGFDEISGGEGGDSLYGQADSDSLSGGAGNDRLSGGGEADQLSGGAGDDVLIGGGGNDIIFDSRGHNRVDAGSGSDAISVRNGARDVVRCGKGKDHVVADRGDRLSGCEHVRRGGRARHHRRR